MSVKININKTNQSKLSEFDPDKIVFGKTFSDHMLVRKYRDASWGEASILPYGKISVSPAMSSLHYGQSIFEGLKAFKSPEGKITLFRPYDNAKRLNKSAIRMCMPELPVQDFVDMLKAFAEIESDWISNTKGHSLYLRPFMFATDEFLGIRPSDNYDFMIYACPVSTYYSAPVNVYIETHYARAVKGGVGSAKCAGNYAASLYPAKLSKAKGYDQNLWTDALTHEFLEETGTSNIFIIKGNQVFTPELNDSILEGITRDSVIKLMKDFGMEVIETKIRVEELIQWHYNKEIDEMFVTGTAATVMNIKSFGNQDNNYALDLEKPLISEKIIEEFYLIRSLQIPDRHGWIEVVK
jgi:branched-chain amino acid aminotransferase